MVLFKRKPVQYASKSPLRDDHDVWVIEETDEVFGSYEEYLQRMDFYKQKWFTCEVTGHSNQSFFEALHSEMEASDEVNDAFPDPLREPILRKVQFSTISRIDNLVDHIFEEFRQDFFPGEIVTIVLNNDRLNGIVREKSKFPELVGPEGRVQRPAFARYFVSLTERPAEEALVDDTHLVRDRKTFTKQMLRSFLKNTVVRESWSGAPWTVKPRIADEYGINSEIPPHLRYDHQVAQRKANLGVKKGEYDGVFNMNFYSPHSKLPELKPKSHKAKSSQDTARSKHEQFLEYQRVLASNPAFSIGRDVPPATEAQYIQFVNSHPGFHSIAAKNVPRPPPPPPVKYPIEDLEVPPVRDGTHRPALKYLSQDIPHPSQSSGAVDNGILMESVGSLLETWDTLNVYCEVFRLDSFTLDDYIQALELTSEDVQCELLVEIHCAILKKLVNDENDRNGQPQVLLPAAIQEDSEEDASTNDSSSRPTPTPEPQAKTPGRTTRSSLTKSEVVNSKMPTGSEIKLHRAAEIDQCVRGYDWKTRLRKRDFRNARWIVIVVGLLNLLSANPRLRKECDHVLTRLAPLDKEATEATAISEYGSLDINLRIKILQILCMLSLETNAIRSYMEDCTLQMTEYRKERVEQQRARKAALEELRLLHEEQKALQPDNTSPVPELEELEDLKMDEADEYEDTIMDDEDEPPHQGRSLRRATDRAQERKRRQEQERDRKEKAEAEKAKRPSKQAKQLEKVLKKIEEAKDKIKECEEEMLTIENDLREADCPRTRVLGKDRFWNRYYWFERNAMPYAGLPDSSTADAGYANGCLWVQGPDDMERCGFIELSEAENDQYRRAFQMSVPDRKMIEEGPTHVFHARQWGYYDDPDQLDALIGWLDVRGVRETKLRKELQSQREKITTYMSKRKEYLASNEDKKPESGELATRVSTRTKTYVDPAGYRCLAWRNMTALDELGHIHSEPVRAQKKQANKPAKKAIEDEPRQTRASNRTSKPPTRQGTRYSFS